MREIGICRGLPAGDAAKHANADRAMTARRIGGPPAAHSRRDAHAYSQTVINTAADGGAVSFAFRRLALASLLVAAAAALGVTLAQDAPPETEADAPQEELQWPRVVEGDGMTFTIYQPQIDKFADAML